MKSDDEVKSRILQAASMIDGLADGQKQKGVAELLSLSENRPLPSRDILNQVDLTGRSDFGVAHRDYGTASIKLPNYFISWRKLILAGSSVPASYLSSTLTAMTILGFLAKGAVHVFDEIDAKILALVHKNSKMLPIATGEFYDRIAGEFPPEINKELFMKRIIDLSGYGAISIEKDILKITEVIYSFD